MYRITALLLTTAALSACATSPVSDKTMSEKNPNATTVDVRAPEPVLPSAAANKVAGTKMTDVMGNKLMTTEAAATAAEASDTSMTKDAPMAEAAPAAQKQPAADAPEKLENLYYVSQTKWEMMRFIEAVNSADLAAALEADTEMTIFAPTSDAFAQAGDVAATAELLKGHIVAGTLSAKDLMARAAKGETTLPTLAGTGLTLYVMGETVKIADETGRLYTVVTADSKASNGVLHQINGVLTGK